MVDKPVPTAVDRRARPSAQQQHIDTLSKTFGGRFRIFKAIESDILPNGSPEYPDEILDSFAMVVAIVHSPFRMGKAEQTERILKAIPNPHTTILGHVTGQQLLKRPGC